MILPCFMCFHWRLAMRAVMLTTSTRVSSTKPAAHACLVPVLDRERWRRYKIITGKRGGRLVTAGAPVSVAEAR